MPNFLKKLSSGANNFFKKVNSGASNFFKKLPDNITKVANDVGDGIVDAANKTGNFLEKNSAIIGDVAGGLVSLVPGMEGVGAGIITAGNAGQVAGRQLKNSSAAIKSTAQQIGQNLNTTIQNAKSTAIAGANNYMNNLNQQANALQMQKQQQAQANVDMMKARAGTLVNNLANNANNAIQNLTIH
jgi:ElaB/YqjD/DUF883 family membrane-anchored ribosome-binding protein